MSIATEITRIAGLRDTIRSKLIGFGVISDESAKLSACSSAIDNMAESTLTVPSIAVTPNVSINTTTGLVTVSGSNSGTASASKGYNKGTSSAVSASASTTYQLTVYTGTVS